MKRFTKLALISTFAVLSTAPVSANIYRVDLTYGSDPDPSENAGLSGFLIINTALDTGNDRNSSFAGSVPNWIPTVSITYDPTPGSPSSGDEVTTTSFDRITWTLSNEGSFDVSADFMDLNGDSNTSDKQFSQFGFHAFGSPSFGYELENALAQQTRGGEFPLSSTATTPGGLPILGLGALFFYYKKLKSKTFKN